MIMKDALLKKRILITGITGFVGSHLAKKLSSLGADVYGISRSDSVGKKVIKADVASFNQLASVIKKNKIQICMHLAGESIVEYGQKNPYQTFSVNTQGALNVLEIARLTNLERVIIASTSHVYGKNRVPYFEGYTPRPSRPYETSKACTDLLAQSYAETFQLPVLIPRFVNIYGPGDTNFYRVIPKTIRSVLLGKSPQMWGGESLRDYLYIDDAIDAYIKLANVNIARIKGNRIFNFGSGNVESVKSLIEKIILFSGSDVLIRHVDDKRTFEIKSQYVSWNKARNFLGWKPKVSLDRGLKETIRWYKFYLENTPS